MTFANCPKCGSSDVTTAGVCANCGWVRFPQVMGAGESKEAIYNLVGEIEIKVTGKALLDDYKRLLFENKSLESHIAELGEQVWNLNLENERMEEAYWIDESIAPDGTLKPSVRKLLERLEKAETDLRLSDDLVKALDNRIAELTECIGSQMADVYTLKARIAELEKLAQQLIWVGNDLLADNTNPVTITLFSGLAFRSKELLP